MTERFFNLVVPLAHEATAMRITDTAGSSLERSGAVSPLIGASLRRGDVDSTNRRSTPPTLVMPGTRISTTATRTTTTRAPLSAPAPSADYSARHHADFSSRTKHVVSVSGGKDSAATLILAVENCPQHSVIPIFCDTGNEHPAVYEYLSYLEQALDVTIIRLKADFAEQIAGKREFIARDRRTRREYDTVPVFEADGKTPVPKRNGRGQIITKKVKRDGLMVVEPVQKTRKVGGGRKVRWSNKAKRRALETLHPTGNPFLDLCMWKGRFPSRKAQFCTEELKRDMAVAFQLELRDMGYSVLSWQGVRRDESLNRKHAKKIERITSRMWVFRPIVDLTAMDVFALCAKRQIQPNPLYLQGMGRVGCMYCINANKDEIREVAIRFPEHPARLAEWENIVCKCSKRGFSTFFHKVDNLTGSAQSIFSRSNIDAVLEWSKTSHGGRQFSLFTEIDESAPSSCSSAYGLCE